jgi:hypothetical protein
MVLARLLMDQGQLHTAHGRIMIGHHAGRGPGGRRADRADPGPGRPRAGAPGRHRPRAREGRARAGAVLLPGASRTRFAGSSTPTTARSLTWT